ncbi:hypothetical protein A2U01_0105354, partial [Trifolium medium]|nr:hypothetical protein [Trifolium medium]
MCIPGIVVTSSMWPFLEEMIANSDDKTVVAINTSHEIDDDTRFLQLFKPFGDVISA